MRLPLAAVLTLIAAPAMANPFSELMAASDGRLCYRGVYDPAAHPGRQTREVLLSFNTEDLWGGQSQVMRLAFRREGGAWYVWGGCGWADKDINRGVGGRILQPEYTLEHGISCHASAGLDEEGGDFPIEYRDDDHLVVYPGEGLAARSGFADDLRSAYAEFSEADLVLPVERVDLAQCAELVKGLGEPIGYPPE